MHHEPQDESVEVPSNDFGQYLEDLDESLYNAIM
jgi:hypothetical protein